MCGLGERQLPEAFVCATDLFSSTYIRSEGDPCGHLLDAEEQLEDAEREQATVHPREDLVDEVRVVGDHRGGEVVLSKVT